VGLVGLVCALAVGGPRWLEQAGAALDRELDAEAVAGKTPSHVWYACATLQVRYSAFARRFAMIPRLPRLTIAPTIGHPSRFAAIDARIVDRTVVGDLRLWLRRRPWQPCARPAFRAG